MANISKFGAKEEREWPCAYGMNVKGGVDYDEAAAYIMNLIVPLYPYGREEKGKLSFSYGRLWPGKK